MTDCHLVEVPISLRGLHVWAEHRGMSLRGVVDEGAALHHLLGETFGPSAFQPFRILPKSGGAIGTLMGYAPIDGVALRDQAGALAAPSVADVLSLDRLRSLPRPATIWKDGQRLGFDVRLRPVIRLASAIEGEVDTLPKGAEVDSYLARVLRDDVSRTREQVYLDWLAERLKSFAVLDPAATTLAKYQRLKVVRKGRRLDGPDVVIHGTLTVRDPAGFAQILARGIGRHRAYGYGMLLLRAPQKARPC